MEDFVKFEIAKKLKEKGSSLNNEDVEFIGCRFIFFDECTIKRISTIGAYEKGYFGKNINCPTIPQVLKWLRKEKKLFVEIGCNYTHYFPTIRMLDCHKTDYIRGDVIYSTYEDAAVAGIEYVLDNLI